MVFDDKNGIIFIMSLTSSEIVRFFAHQPHTNRTPIIFSLYQDYSQYYAQFCVRFSAHFE